MLYAVYVHAGDGEGYGMTIPDLPGCFPGADAWDGIPAAVQEAVELYFEGEDMELPNPTPPDALMAHPEYDGGFWVLVDIDITRIKPKSQRLNVTLPQPLVRRIDAYARAHGETRSGFLARAAQKIMEGNAGSEAG